MSKQKIGAREAVADIKSGMSDAELMKKYGLSPKGLENLFRKLVEAKLLEESFVGERTASVAGDGGAKSGQASAPIPESGHPESGKPSDLDLAVLQDIKDGRHDNEIMRRHEVSPGQLMQIRATLAQSGLLDAGGTSPSGRSDTRLCPSCSQEVSASASECEHCGRWLDPASSTGPAEAAAPVRPAAGVVTHEERIHEEPLGEDKECPWEERESYGTVNAYFQTATKLLLTPTSFFSKLPTSGGYFNPILFAAMAFPVAIVLSYLWTGLFTGMRLGGFFAILLGMSCAFVGALIFVPIWLAIKSGLFHLCLYLMGGVREGYEATFRVVSYSSVTSILSAVPVVGSLAGVVWELILNVIGLREVHKTTTGKAVAAVAIPVGVGLVIVVISVAVGVASLAKFGLGSGTGKVPRQACEAVETYIARVDGSASLEAQAMDTEVQAAMRDLMKDLQPSKGQPNIPSLQQKAILFGIATIQQAKTGKQFGKGVDEMREELRKMCRR